MNEYRLAFEVISPLSVEQLSTSFLDELDGILVERSGVIVATVYAEGPTGLDAAYGAIRHLERLDMSVCHVDLDLVDGPEISARLEVTRQAVQHWASGSRGSGFPRPLGSPGGKRLWAWGQIVEWARAHQGSTETPGLTRDETALVDAHLATRRRNVTYPGWALSAGSAKTQASVHGVDDYRGSALTVRGNA